MLWTSPTIGKPHHQRILSVHTVEGGTTNEISTEAVVLLTLRDGQSFEVSSLNLSFRTRSGSPLTIHGAPIRTGLDDFSVHLYPDEPRILGLLERSDIGQTPFKDSGDQPRNKHARNHQ